MVQWHVPAGILTIAPSVVTLRRAVCTSVLLQLAALIVCASVLGGGGRQSRIAVNPKIPADARIMGAIDLKRGAATPPPFLRVQVS